MPNIAVVLKQEISRLAKKEARGIVVGLRKDVVRLKRDAADLKRRIAQLERQNKILLASESKRQAEAPEPPPDSTSSARITSKGIRSLRKKLKLSQAKMAALIGATAQSVYIWERKDGALRLRDRTRKAVIALRAIGAKEAKTRLDEIAEEEKATRQKKTTRKKAAKKRGSKKKVAKKKVARKKTAGKKRR